MFFCHFFLFVVDIGALRVDKQNLCDCDQKCYSKLLPEQMHVCLRWPFCCLREHCWTKRVRERSRALLESTRAVEGALGVDESG